LQFNVLSTSTNAAHWADSMVKWIFRDAIAEPMGIVDSGLYEASSQHRDAIARRPPHFSFVLLRATNTMRKSSKERFGVDLLPET